MLVHIVMPHHHHSNQVVVIDWNYSSLNLQDDSKSSCATSETPQHHHSHTIQEHCALQETVVTPIKTFEAQFSILKLLFPIEAPTLVTDIRLMNIQFMQNCYIPPNLIYYFHYIPLSQGVRGSPLY